MKLITGDPVTIIPLLHQHGLRRECAAINCNDAPSHCVVNEHGPMFAPLCDAHLQAAKDGRINVVWNKTK